MPMEILSAIENCHNEIFLYQVSLQINLVSSLILFRPKCLISWMFAFEKI